VFAAIFAFVFQAADIAAFLILAASGLAIVYGMMGVINLAQGEFIMCGAYVTAVAVHAGVPLPVAILLGALVAGIIGIALERLVVHRLYHRPLDSLVATWGISLIATQGLLIVLGPTFQGIATPQGNFTVGELSFATYRVVLMTVAVAVLAAIWFIFMRTRFGLHARATIENVGMARALGVPTPRVYALTFGLGCALAGLTGGLYAPTLPLTPTIGGVFIVEAFITVIVGGADALLGTALAGLLLGTTSAALTAWQGQIYGQIGLLAMVVIIGRLLPGGMTGWLLRRSS
jgi:branched-chain amino acid transport system permease protein